MRHFPVLVFGIGLFVSSAVSASSAQATATSSNVAKSKLAFEEAVAAVQAREPHSGSSFRLIRELAPSPATQEAAQRSLEAASSNHVPLYGDGIFIELMRTGGFVMLEINDRNDKAISLHLVSRTASGRVLIESNPVEGEVSARVAQALTAESSDVVEALFATPINSSALENKFDGGHFPKSQNLDDEETNNLFAMPSDMEKAGTNQSDLRELAVLLGAIDTWPIRYAISSPISPADPMRGLETGVRRLVALSKEFVPSNRDALDAFHLLQDLRSIRNPEQLQDRLHTLKAFSDFLQQKSSSPETLTTFAANESISNIPLKLGFNGTPDDSYGVMTVSGIIMGWKVSSDGAPVLTRMGLAGE